MLKKNLNLKLFFFAKLFLFLFIINLKSYAENSQLKTNLTIGSENAAVKIKVFSSLTCPHCADFHTKVIPEIKKNYIDSGKVQLILIDFPLDQAGFNASKLLHCVDDKKKLTFLDTIYENQNEWTIGGSIEEINNNLREIVKNLGISSSQFDTCLIDDVISASSDSLSNEGAKFARVLPKDSILVSCIGNLGKSGINSIPVAFNQQINAIIPNERSNPRFMFYQVQSFTFRKQLYNLKSGTTVDIVNKSKFNTIRVVLPSLPEQKRIVTILDQAFQEIDQTIANTEKNLTNAKEIFESYLNDVFTKKGEGLEEKKLGELFDIGSSKRVLKSDWKLQGVPFYRAREIKKLSLYGEVDNQLFISEEMFSQYSRKYGSPKEGDLMVTAVGTIGICYAVKNTDRFYFKDASVLWFKNKNKIDSRFAEYAFKTNLIKKQINCQEGEGATVDTYTIGRAKNTIIMIPSLPEQKRIVKKLDELTKETQQLETLYQEKISALTELKQSLLQKAFSGELTKDKAA